MSGFRILRPGDEVVITGLVSAPQYNAANAAVVRYLMDKDRYQVQIRLQSAGGAKVSKKVLAVKRENALPRENGSKDMDKCGISMHVLVPCHLNDDRRYAQFFECLKSLCEQHDASYRAFFGVSGTKERRDEAICLLRHLNQGLLEKRKVRADWYVLVEEGQEEKSQFEHLKDMLEVSSSVDPNAWLMFLDNDDMYHPERVRHFKRQALRCDSGGLGEPVDAFWSGGKLLLDAAKIGDRYVTLEKLLRCDESLDGFVRVAATPEENSVMDVDEYFDFCARTSVMQKFFELTPDALLKNPFCDVRFMASLGRICNKAFRHPEHEWLLMHYRIKHEDRNKAFMDRDAEKHSNVMMSVQITDTDRDLSDKTGVEAVVIAWCRKDIEEGVIQFIARDEQNLEERRKRLTAHMDEEFGHNIGTLLWEETCENFSSCFTGELLEKNKAWCMEGRVPYKVFTEEVDGSFDDHY